jgi:hypothetical protein
MKLPAGALASLLALTSTDTFAQQDASPKLIPMGCNLDGGFTWLAVGKATVGPQPGTFRVEVEDIDLDRVEASISPSSMDMYMPYGLGPVVGPISVASTTIAPRRVNGVANGNIVTVRFTVLSTIADPADLLTTGAIAYVLVLDAKNRGCQANP